MKLIIRTEYKDSHTNTHRCCPPNSSNGLRGRGTVESIHKPVSLQFRLVWQWSGEVWSGAGSWQGGGGGGQVFRSKARPRYEGRPEREKLLTSHLTQIRNAAGQLLATNKLHFPTD